VKRRSGQTEDYLPPAQRRAYESQARFAKGGAAKMTPAWRDRPFAAHKNGSGLKIHAPHSGEGLVMNIHLSNVGPHAISFHSGPDGYNGGVDSSRMVQRQASHALQSDARPTPFPVMRAPQLGLQGAPGGGFGQVIGQPTAPGLSAWNAEGARTLANMKD
jgi:hypothetical protein